MKIRGRGFGFPVTPWVNRARPPVVDVPKEGVMKIRLSRGLAAALLAVVLSLSIAPSSYASRRDDSGPGDMRDRIVRFIRDIRHFFGSTNADQLVNPHP